MFFLKLINLRVAKKVSSLIIRRKGQAAVRHKGYIFKQFFYLNNSDIYCFFFFVLRSVH